MGRSHTERPKNSEHFSIGEDFAHVQTQESEKLPKLHRSHTQGEETFKGKYSMVTPNPESEIVELHFELNAKRAVDLEFERILQKDEEIPFDEYGFYKVFKTKTKSNKKGLKKLFGKETRYMYFRDGILYVTKKKDGKTAIVRTAIVLSRVCKIEIDEDKETVYFIVDSDDLSQNKIIEKEYQSEFFDDFLDRLEEELEPLNASVKLVEDE